MTIGLKDLFFAICTETEGVESYGKPKRLAEAMTADLSVSIAEATLHADDAASETIKEFIKGTLKLGIKDLTIDTIAEILGQEKDSNNVIYAGGSDEAPYLAVGFRARKTGGNYRYIWLLKVKFKVPNEKYQTKGESITFNTPEIEGDFFVTKKNNKWKSDYVGLETSDVAKGWFEAVKEYVEEAPESVTE